MRSHKNEIKDDSLERRLQGEFHKIYAQVRWWRHDMETHSASLALHEGNPLVSGGFFSQGVTNVSFDIYFCKTEQAIENAHCWFAFWLVYEFLRHSYHLVPV